MFWNMSRERNAGHPGRSLGALGRGPALVRNTLFFALAALSGNTLLASESQDGVDDFLVARQQFEAGRAGSPSASAAARQLFGELVRRDARNPLYLAYYGSSVVMQGRDSAAPWTRLRLAYEGVGILDRALAMVEQQRGQYPAGPIEVELESRLVAIATFIALPQPVFHRMDVARSQLRTAFASPRFPVASADLRGHLIYEGALIARQDGDRVAERAALLQVQALAPPSVDLRDVRNRLAELH
jgi:hypothetical protein